MFTSITFTETGVDETNETQQKVGDSKFMLKISTIHANTCIQTTTPRAIAATMMVWSSSI